jgi:hypothetical protein
LLAICYTYGRALCETTGDLAASLSDCCGPTICLHTYQYRTIYPSVYHTSITDGCRTTSRLHINTGWLQCQTLSEPEKPHMSWAFQIPSPVANNFCILDAKLMTSLEANFLKILSWMHCAQSTRFNFNGNGIGHSKSRSRHVPSLRRECPTEVN